MLETKNNRHTILTKVHSYKILNLVRCERRKTYPRFRRPKNVLDLMVKVLTFARCAQISPGWRGGSASAQYVARVRWKAAGWGALKSAKTFQPSKNVKLHLSPSTCDEKDAQRKHGSFTIREVMFYLITSSTCGWILRLWSKGLKPGFPNVEIILPPSSSLKLTAELQRCDKRENTSSPASEAHRGECLMSSAVERVPIYGGCREDRAIHPRRVVMKCPLVLRD